MSTGIHIPTAPRAGEKINAVFMRELTQALRRNSPIAGAGIKIERTMGGTVISANTSARGISQPTKPHIWEIKKSQADSGFVIYLGEPYQTGSAPHALNIGGEELDIDGVEASVDPKLSAEGWKKVTGFTGGEMWLVLASNSSTSTCEARIDSSAGAASEVGVRIGCVSVDSSSSVTTIYQDLVGAVFAGVNKNGMPDEPTPVPPSSNYVYGSVDVVVDVAYDSTTHTLTQTKKSICAWLDANSATTNVFVAVPHISHD